MARKKTLLQISEDEQAPVDLKHLYDKPTFTMPYANNDPYVAPKTTWLGNFISGLKNVGNGFLKFANTPIATPTLKVNLSPAQLKPKPVISSGLKNVGSGLKDAIGRGAASVDTTALNLIRTPANLINNGLGKILPKNIYDPTKSTPINYLNNLNSQYQNLMKQTDAIKRTTAGNIAYKAGQLIPEGLGFAASMALPLGKLGKLGDALDNGVGSVGKIAPKVFGNNVASRIAESGLKTGAEMGVLNAGQTSGSMLLNKNERSTPLNELKTIGSSTLQGAIGGALFGAGGKGISEAFKGFKPNIKALDVNIPTSKLDVLNKAIDKPVIDPLKTSTDTIKSTNVQVEWDKAEIEIKAHSETLKQLADKKQVLLKSNEDVKTIQTQSKLIDTKMNNISDKQGKLLQSQTVLENKGAVNRNVQKYKETHNLPIEDTNTVNNIENPLKVETPAIIKPLNILGNNNQSNNSTEQTTAAIEKPLNTQVSNPVEDVAATTDNTAVTTDNEGLKSRQFVDNSVQNSEVSTPEMKNTIADPVYKPISNKETWSAAQSRVNADPQNSLNEFISNDKVSSADDTALGEALINKAIQENRISDANSLSINLAEKLTKAGQTVQAASIFKRLTPEGMLQYANKTINNANLKLSPKAQIKLSDKVAQEITDQMKIINDMPEGEAKTVETQKVLKKIVDQIPAGLLKKIDTLQTMSQLLNFKTGTRNILGNAGMVVGENISNTIGTPLDKVVSLFTHKRTVGLPSVLTQTKGFVKGGIKSIKEVKQGISMDATQNDLPLGKVFSNSPLGKVANAGQKILDYFLKVPDEAFKGAIRDDSLRKQMKFAKVTEPTQLMKDIAENDAKYGTFQDDTALARGFGKIKQALSGGKEFGAGSVFLKYPKTPANIIMRALDYSPAGFFNSVYRLAEPLIRGGEFNQKAFVQATSRALVGSVGGIGSGFVLSKLGIISGSYDPKTADLNTVSGLGSYQLNVSALKRFVINGFNPNNAALQKGDKLISYDWFQPAAIAFAIGADVAKSKSVKDVDIFSTIADAIDSGATTLMQQPLIAGIQKAAAQRDPMLAIENALQQIPSSMTPTILKQVAQLMDNTTRNTYDPSWMKTALNMVQSKIPGQSSKLQPKLNSFGDTQKAFENNNVGNVMFNPAFTKTYNPDVSATNAINMFNDTQDSSLMPQIVNKSITFDKKTYKLTSQQLTDYQKDLGQKVKAIYANSPTEEDAKTQISDANNQAKADLYKVLGDEPVSFTKSKISDTLNGNNGSEAAAARKEAATIYSGSMDVDTKKKLLNQINEDAKSISMPVTDITKVISDGLKDNTSGEAATMRKEVTAITHGSLSVKDQRVELQKLADEVSNVAVEKAKTNPNKDFTTSITTSLKYNVSKEAKAIRKKVTEIKASNLSTVEQRNLLQGLSDQAVNAKVQTAKPRKKKTVLNPFNK